MRAAMSILGLVIVFAIVMFSMRHQVQAIKELPRPAGASAAAAPNLPAAVHDQVNDSVMQAASAAASAVDQQTER
ncbi:MAG: hypothetical protein JO369_00885 [Paucibacter sp.]|nr:hypothetical protein [Roseateles sp.]